MINSKQFLATTLAITLSLSLLPMSPAFAGAGTQPGDDTDPRFGQCGAMDVAFAVDNTGSMSGAIASIKTNIGTIIGEIATASAGDYRLGLITFDDNVDVKRNLAAVPNEVEAFIAGGGIGSTAGGGAPETSDQAKNTALNNLADTASSPRADADGNPSNAGDQTGTFVPAWRAGAVKILVLFTDNLPGGWNDASSAADQTFFSDIGMAGGIPNPNGVFVSDVFVPTPGSNAAMIPLMQADAMNTGGIFKQANPDGSGTATAIMEIIDMCGGAMGVGGSIIPTSTTSLLVAGIGANAALLIPIIVGVAGTAAYFTRSYWNKSEE